MQLSSRLPWYGLLGAALLVPLVVGATPVEGIPLTLNAFVQAKLIILCLAIAISLASWGALSAWGGVIYTGRALLPLGAFIAVLGLSTAFALDPRMAFFGDSEQGVGALVFLVCILACFLTTQLVRNESNLGELTAVVILAAAAVALVGLSQQIVGFDPTGVIKWGAPTTWQMRRGFGTIGNADTLGAYLVLPAILGVTKLLRSQNRQDQILWGSCSALILMACVVSQTRGALLGLLVGGMLFAVSERAASRRSKTGKKARLKSTGAEPLVVAVVMTVAVVGGLLITAVLANGDFGGAWHDFLARFGSLQSLIALGGRIPLWGTALKIAVAHPLLGVGPDSFRLGWYPLRSVAHLAGGAGLVIRDPHSVPLLLAATMGLAGLAAAGYLMVAALMSGYRTASTARASRSHASDYDGWLFGFVALSVTLLSSMLASVLLFMLFLGIGVLIAPALAKAESPPWNRAGFIAVSFVSIAVGVALAAFALLGAAAQLTAVGVRSGDADTGYGRATRAVALAPWDTQLRELKNEMMVQAALDHVFTGKSDAAATLASAEKSLEQAAAREPYEYLHPYRSAILLIGAGQKLGVEYTKRGIDAGLRGLRIYPNSLELRTGVASGYLQLSQPEKAEALLKDFWEADPNYSAIGVAYVRALIAQGKLDEAQSALTIMEIRFPQEQAIADLQSQVSPK